MADNWMDRSLAQLREEAKMRGMKGISGMKKKELAERLAAADYSIPEEELAAAAAADLTEESPKAAADFTKDDNEAAADLTEERARAEADLSSDFSGETAAAYETDQTGESRERRQNQSISRGNRTSERSSSRRDYGQREGSSRDYGQREGNGRSYTSRENGMNSRRNSGVAEGGRRSTSDSRDGGNMRRYTSDNRDNSRRTGDYDNRDNSRRTGDYDSRDNSRRTGDYDSRDNSRRTGDYVSRRMTSDNRDNADNRRYNSEQANRSTAGEEGGRERVYMEGWNTGTRNEGMSMDDMKSLDSGEMAHGILQLVPDNNFGFIRGENFESHDNDIYVSPSQIRRFKMRTGDMVRGPIRVRNGSEKFQALLYVSDINGEHPSLAEHRSNFEDLTPIFPNERLHLESEDCSRAMRIVDLLSPVGKGQRGMIVSPPKAGKTTLLKETAKSITKNHPETHLIILLIDERPEEVTDIKESIQGDNVEIIYSTFDETPDHHKLVSEMVLGRAKSLVEFGRDVVILLDSITRLARAYNLTVTGSGRTLSGGLDPAALHMPKKFFGAARNMREGGSLTILATALVDTGSRMDDMVFEEFKGTGNMEVVLDRKMSERRIFPAIDIARSGTRRDDLLLTKDEKEAVDRIRRGLTGMKQEEALEQILNMFSRTKNNQEFVAMVKTMRF